MSFRPLASLLVRDRSRGYAPHSRLASGQKSCASQSHLESSLESVVGAQRRRPLPRRVGSLREIEIGVRVINFTVRLPFVYHLFTVSLPFLYRFFIDFGLSQAVKARGGKEKK